jgi:hypothetical protein
MKKVNFFLLVLVLIFSAIVISAQEEEKINIPPGMEVVESGTVKLIVPTGSKVHQEGGLITVEDIGAYVGRRFLDVENSLTELKTKQENLEEEMRELRETLDKIQLDKTQKLD